MDSLEKKKIWSDIITSWVGLIGVLGALIFGSFQYLDSKNRNLDDKKKASLSYAELYDSKQMFEVRKTVDLIVIPVLTLAKEQASNATTPQQADQISRETISNSMTNAIESNENYKSVQEIITFFDRAWNCVSLDLCDADATAGLLYEYAYSLNFMFSSYIEHLQRTKPSLGSGISGIISHQEK